MRPFCAKCCREMFPLKNDRRVEIRGEMWSGDEYVCPRCNAKIVTGWGNGPVASMFDPTANYEERRRVQIKLNNLLVEAE